MSRRHGTSLKILLAVAVGGLFVYGMYSYHDVHTRLKRSEEKGDRLHQQHDSLSAQLQVVYEHKSRLEKSLQQEKSDHRKSRTELMNQQSSMESKYMREKQELLNRINSINQEHKMLKSQHEDLETEYAKITEQKSKLEEDHRKLTEQHNIEYQQLQQERNNDVATLRDKIANLQRKSDDLEKQLAVALQNYQMNQAEIDRQKALIEHQRQQQQAMQQQVLQQQQLLQQQQVQHEQDVQKDLQQQQQRHEQRQQQHEQQQQQHEQQQQQHEQQQQRKEQRQRQQQYQKAQQQQHEQQPFYVNQQYLDNNAPEQAGHKQGGLPLPGQDMIFQQPQQHQQPQQKQQQQQQQQQPLQRNNLGQPALALPLQGQGQGQGQGQDTGNVGNQNKGLEQDQVQMQIRQPGDNQHPGYHQVKQPDGQGHPKVEVQVEGHAAQPELDGEHKDVQLQQVRAPNMSPEKNETLSWNGTVIGRKFLRRFRNGLVQSTENIHEQKPRLARILNPNLGVGTARKTEQEGRALAINAPEGAKEGQRVKNTQMGLGPAAHFGGKKLESQRDDSDKAKQDDRDMDQNDAQAGGHRLDGNFQMKEPNLDQERLNLANPHDDQNRGPFGGKAADRDQIHAPVQPNALQQPDGQLQVPIIDHQGHANENGQMERPNLVPPMVNNMNQENQVPVPKAPKLKDNDLLMKGQQVNDDDDYDTDNRNDNGDQQDNQDDDDKDDDNNYGNIKK